MTNLGHLCASALIYDTNAHKCPPAAPPAAPSSDRAGLADSLTAALATR